MPGQTVFTVPVPEARGPIPVTENSYPFSTMVHAREPLDLAEFGYVEEEYFLRGTANVYGFSNSIQPAGTPAATTAATGTGADSAGQAKERPITVVEENVPYMTRVLIRRPADSDPKTAWVSILNASQGYDIEDDWRRAWDYIISRRLTYVAVTAKPIQVSALQTFDPERYADLTWGGKPKQLDASAPGWNPFATLPENEEGLAWDVIAQVAAWLRSGTAPTTPEHVFLIGQSQSAVYTNTYLTYFHQILKLAGGANPYDGYAPGVGGLYVKAINQRESGIPQTIGQAPDLSAPDDAEKAPAFAIYLVAPAQIDVPVIAISSEADVSLYEGTPASFCLGDGPWRRHWHVLRTPHSDARSRVIPNNSETQKAKRQARVTNPEFLAQVSPLPLEPVVTAAMAAIENWVQTGTPAAPSRWFTHHGNQWEIRNGLLTGGIVISMVAHPIADFLPGSPENPVYGQMRLHSAASIRQQYASFADYQAACDAVDNELEAQGYLEPVGRNFLHNVQRELWDRAIDGAPAPLSSPQEIIDLES
ncbi:alpha/beta hydrolase domain-containing protein [Actinobaculum suis]|uniref:alpha/beta hydrolase domain-containing protein n=1 Tax=Actinobaculum suis TaxID=1657 RepID=UPI00080A6791|nr:alpha/beta hydrolase domain-containing protein [Actinobaculum suis]OCA95986.1 hypothetical protein ACU20_02860 [Actinobaculum suis]